jgi:mono/diheme cytochrome c family protein
MKKQYVSRRVSTRHARVRAPQTRSIVWMAALAGFLAAQGLFAAAAVSADSVRGKQVFEAQGCGQCHALNGVGPTIGPDLGLITDRGFTPAALAATMWNHAPAMWVETKLRSVPPPAMDEQQAADIYAFFYSLRFFEEPGDAARGKTLFTSRQCATCHGITDTKAAGVKPVSEWTAASDPLDMVETMWNHSTAMRDEMARRNIRLPQLKGQELADLLVYTRRATGRGRPAAEFRVASGEEGKALFESKRCASCHGELAHFLSTEMRDETLTDIAADMWNHGLDMRLRDSKFAPGEMRQIVGYIWYSRTIEGAGAAGRGAQVFAAKKCTVCHDDPASGAPSLAGLRANDKYFSGATMISALTRHGPKMLDRMKEKNVAWPRFSAEDMSGLIAYLNTRSARNPKP